MSELAEDTLDWQSRLEILQQGYGFLPTTSQELHQAFGAIPFVDTPGGVGGHLNEILRHQIKSRAVDPAAAVRTYTRSMGAYMLDAASRRQALLVTHGNLALINPYLEIGQIDFSEDIGLHGLLSAVQYRHIRDSIKTGELRPLEGGYRRPRHQLNKRLMTHYDIETNDETMVQIVMGPMINEKVVALKSLVAQAGKSHKNRQEFWENMLDSSRSHLVAKPIIEELLG